MNFTQRMSLGVAAAALMGAILAADRAAANTLEVSTTVPDVCTVAMGALVFPDYESDRANDLQGSGSFEVNCSIAADVNIKLSGGNQVDGTLRHMLGQNLADLLSYQLFVPPLNGPWGDDNESINLPSRQINLNPGPQTIFVDGTIGAGQEIRGDAYSDIVEISLAFN